ncbi:hypothetical protein F3Y22_tig00111582pilonHSYRG01212 [Hibiscus syriacus]|uniref:Uncharacterized protein n=1 Tax=Hibiscus syriacus TaxID=106335 RepID=A0A6A2Y0V7_HIBSY|nr:hypothetical protein F3Y22_tig00111582pilonHSYRG01212 [Hibiscus syriacus]
MVLSQEKLRNLHIIHELGSNHDARNKQPMNVERIDGQRGLPLSKPIEINAVEDRHLRRLKPTIYVVGFGNVLDERKERKVMRFCIKFGFSSSAMADQVFGPEELNVL